MMAKLNFQQPLFQSLVSHFFRNQEIILIRWFCDLSLDFHFWSISFSLLEKKILLNSNIWREM